MSAYRSRLNSRIHPPADETVELGADEIGQNPPLVCATVARTAAKAAAARIPSTRSAGPQARVATSFRSGDCPGFPARPPRADTAARVELCGRARQGNDQGQCDGECHGIPTQGDSCPSSKARSRRRSLASSVLSSIQRPRRLTDPETRRPSPVPRAPRPPAPRSTGQGRGEIGIEKPRFARLICGATRLPMPIARWPSKEAPTTGKPNCQQDAEDAVAQSAMEQRHEHQWGRGGKEHERVAEPRHGFAVDAQGERNAEGHEREELTDDRRLSAVRADQAPKPNPMEMPAIEPAPLAASRTIRAHTPPRSPRIVSLATAANAETKTQELQPAGSPRRGKGGRSPRRPCRFGPGSALRARPTPAPPTAAPPSGRPPA